MKDIAKIKSYRTKYKRYYGIDFSSAYDIHHIDFNHENNDIDNLILLPKDLHARYHFLVSSLLGVDKKGCIKVDVRLNTQNTHYFAKELKNLGECLQELAEWVSYKQMLDIEKMRREDRLDVYFQGKQNK